MRAALAAAEEGEGGEGGGLVYGWGLGKMRGK